MGDPSPEERLKAEARNLGFTLCGIAPASDADHFDRFQEWLERDFAGEMGYLHQHREARRNPASVFPAVRCVVMLGMEYRSLRTRPSTMARYACGPDYHDVIHERLKSLLAFAQTLLPGCTGRGVVDTAPLLERDFARRAGLGWFGKNTMLISPKRGSFFFLAALLLDQPLHPDAPFERHHCGTCTACIQACPTGAIVAPGTLDARLCISYLTIELRTSVPEALRPAMGEWMFGCDICQEVCPWNRKTTGPGSLPFREDLEALDPLEVLQLSEEEFRAKFRGTAIFRTRRRGLLRNAAIVSGNRGTADALPVLRRLLDDPEPLLREAAAWAIERIAERLNSSTRPLPESPVP